MVVEEAERRQIQVKRVSNCCAPVCDRSPVTGIEVERWTKLVGCMGSTLQSRVDVRKFGTKEASSSARSLGNSAGRIT